MSVITRFAPSPTGDLHLGGARTALFNYLFARRHNGKYLVRIEDTDKVRSDKKYVDAIANGLDWLGIAPDNVSTLYYQSAHIADHQQTAQTLLDSGAAYRCYLTDGDLQARRDAMHATGKAFRSPWRDRDPSTAPKGTASVVRLKMPDSGSTTIDDIVKGRVTINNDQLDDLVLLRGDGSPTYMLAVVVDDHAMGVSHIIRGDDHFNNAFRQWHIIRALGWQAPVYAHLPLIHTSAGKKMSKRNMADGVGVSLADYVQQGFLADAMLNYLLRLGWSHGDAEVISRDQAIAWFDLDGIGASAARFDVKKLIALNAHYIREMDDKALAQAIVAHAKPNTSQPALVSDAVGRMTMLAPALKKRATTLADLADMAGFAMYDIPPNPDAIPLDADGKARLLQLASDYPSGAMDSVAVAAWLSDWLARQHIGLGDIGPQVRMALTGTRTAPDVASVLASLGKQQIHRRIQAFVV